MINTLDPNTLKELSLIPVYSNISGLNLASLYKMKFPFYIPIDPTSLDSEFCPGLKWRDIIESENVKTVTIGDSKFVPVRIKLIKIQKQNIILSVHYILEPSKRIIIPYRHQTITHHSSLSNKFYFNNYEFDVYNLKKTIPFMKKENLLSLGHLILSSIKKLCDVDYIITDTNCWCTGNSNGELLYERVLKRIGNYLLRYHPATKFLVTSEILVELKSLCKKEKAARAAQRLLHDHFMPLNLIYNPNPDEEFSRNVYADPSLREQVKKQYLAKRSISFITNDQQLMMLAQCSINNSASPGLITPNFLSLNHISQLFQLGDEIKAHIKLS